MSKDVADSKQIMDRDSNITIPRLSHKLQRIHNYLGLTNGELLVKVNPDERNGNNRSRISDYEKELREPSLVEVLNYARLVGIRLEILLDSKLNLPDEIENCPDHPRCKKRKTAVKQKKKKGGTKQNISKSIEKADSKTAKKSHLQT